jgi:hypothetical protein
MFVRRACPLRRAGVGLNKSPYVAFYQDATSELAERLY